MTDESIPSPTPYSRSEIKRRVIVEGGTMDEAFEEIKRVESRATSLPAKEETPLTSEAKWKELAIEYTRIGSIEECAYWKEVARSAPNAAVPTSPDGNRSGSASDATPTESSALPSNVKEAIRDFQEAAENNREAQLDRDAGSVDRESYESELSAARSRLEDLYARQREANARIAKDANATIAVCRELRAALASLKDEQLTAEELEFLELVAGQWNSLRLGQHQLTFFSAILSKLRSLSYTNKQK